MNLERIVILILLVAAVNWSHLGNPKSDFEVKMRSYGSGSYGGESIEDISDQGSDVSSAFAKYRGEIEPLLTKNPAIPEKQFDHASVKLRIRIGEVVYFIDRNGRVKNGRKYSYMTKSHLGNLILIMYRALPSPPSQESRDQLISQAPP